MGFSTVHGSPQIIWVPVEPGEVMYNGSIVAVNSSALLEGVGPMPAAAGASNTTNLDVPFGVVVGNNNVEGNIQFSSTYNTEYITQVAAGTPYGSNTEYRGVDGPWKKGDPQAMVKIAVICPQTIIRGPLFNGAVGTAPTVVTVSTGSGGDGIGCTTDATDATIVATYGTINARSGANNGVRRTTTSNSSTVHTWLKAFKADMAVGDTAVVVNGVRPYGLARIQIDSEAQYIDVSAALSSDYFNIFVHKLELSEPGNEYVEFRFDGDNFCTTRA